MAPSNRYHRELIDQQLVICRAYGELDAKARHALEAILHTLASAPVDEDHDLEWPIGILQSLGRESVVAVLCFFNTVADNACADQSGVGIDFCDEVERLLAQQ